MKNFNKIFLISSLFALSFQVSFAQWDAVRFDERNTYTKIASVDQSTVFSVGVDPGTNTNFILRSNNGGGSWDSIPLSGQPAASLNDLFFVDAQNGFASGSINGNQLLIKTTDNGNTWTTVTPEPAAQYPIVAVSFSDAMNGLASNNLKLYRTTDGGATWTSQTPSYFISALYHKSANIVFASGGDMNSNEAVLYRSTDGGQTWAPVLQETNTTVFVSSFGRVIFPDQNTGFVHFQSTNLLYRSIDGGNNWLALTIPTAGIIQDYDFSTIDTGRALTSEGEIFKTIDGGNSWTLEYTTGAGAYGPSVFLNSVDFSSATGYVGATNGLIKKYTPESLTSVSNFDSNDFVVYPNPASTGGPVRIQLNAEAQAEVRILDAQGRSYKNGIVGKNEELNITDLSAGIYFIEVKTGERVGVKRLVVTK